MFNWYNRKQKITSFLYILYYNDNSIELSVNMIYKFMKKYITKKQIYNLLNKYDGIEIYNVIKCKQTIFDEINGVLLFYKLKYNIDITYCLRYYYCTYINSYSNFKTRELHKIILFNNLCITTFIKRNIFTFEDVITLYEQLSNFKLKSSSHMLLFKNKDCKVDFCINLFKLIIENNNILLKEIFNTICKDNECFKKFFNVSM